MPLSRGSAPSTLPRCTHCCTSQGNHAGCQIAPVRDSLAEQLAPQTVQVDVGNVFVKEQAIEWPEGRQLTKR